MRTTLPVILIIFCCQSLHAQYLDSIIKRLEKNAPAETIYIHYDKDVYAPGETIWFKAYLFTNNMPSEISTNFYAEIYDTKGILIERKLYPIVSGSAYGYFVIPDSLLINKIYFRAYTPFILKNHRTNIYEQSIPLSGKGITFTDPGPSVPSLHFYPEGGTMVNGVTTRVAFKSTYADGNPVPISGIVKNSSGGTVTTITTGKDGMGVFDFTPSQNQYEAVWYDGQKRMYSSLLPAAKNEGPVLNVSNEVDKISFSVSINPESKKDRSVYYLLVHRGKNYFYEIKLNLENSFSVKGNVPSGDMGTGVTAFTLFNSRQQPVAERVVFIQNPGFRSAATFKKNKNGSGNGYDDYEIELSDTALANMSIAIKEADSLFRNQPDIFSEVLLSPYFKEKINYASGCFTHSSPECRAYADLLMLTNTYNRSIWDIMKADTASVTVPENYITLKGTVKDLTSEELASAGDLILLLKEKEKLLDVMSLKLQKDGSFTADGLLLFDTITISYYLSNLKNKNFRVLLDDIRYSNVSYGNPGGMGNNVNTTTGYSQNQTKSNSPNEIKYADSAVASKQLKEIIITGRKKTRVQMLDEFYTTGPFKSDKAYKFDIEGDAFKEAMIDIVQYLTGRVPGLQIVRSSYAGSDVKITWRQSVVAVYIDEMFTDQSALLQMPVQNIAYVKVFRPHFIGMPALAGSGSSSGFGLSRDNGGLGAGGAIAIYTKRGNKDDKKNKPILSNNTVEFYGFSSTGDFDTNVNRNTENAAGNNSTGKTVYWNPSVVTGGKRNKAVITTRSLPGDKKYVLTLEGANVKGELVRIEKIIN
ncbi:MAG: hypothetical protein K2X48_02010 [Chitinophagaceae bacterium]|nr:hypothetical protein [Chitinophagaceae bacterium]